MGLDRAAALLSLSWADAWHLTRTGPQFCDNGSLHEVLAAKRATPEKLPFARRLVFAIDAARGLSYLHTSRPATIHADLNTSNLLVDRAWRVKVADFGLSRLLQNAPRGVIQGTNVSNKNASHLAPEVLRSEPYGTPSDVFSFGCVMWTLATLRCVAWRARVPRCHARADALGSPCASQRAVGEAAGDWEQPGHRAPHRV